MQITDYSRNYLTNELSTRMTTSSVSSNTTEQNTLAASGSKSFDTFTSSNRSETISTTYSPMTVSANTRASSTTELSIRGLIARKAGVPVTSTGEPYINNGSDSMKYNAALKAYEQSANKAAYFADLEVDSDGNAIFNSNADKAAYAQALYEYTNALGIMDKIDENFNFTQASYTPSGNMKQPKGACAAFAYAAALSYLTDSTVDPKNLNLYTPAGANYTALSNWSYTDPRTGNEYNTETHYPNMTTNKEKIFAEIDQELGKGNGPILFHVNNTSEGEHWALITGKMANGEYEVFDPYYGKVGTLDDMLRYSDTNCKYNYKVITVN